MSASQKEITQILTQHKEKTVINSPPHCKHDLFHRRSTVHEYTRTIDYVTLTSCPECQSRIKAYDPYRGESICSTCGIILATGTEIDPLYFLDLNTEPLPMNDGLLRRDEKHIMAKLTKKPYHTDKGEWRLRQYYFFAEKVARHYHMAAGLEFILLRIVCDYKLKLFHPRLSYQKIILGIAIEILRRNKRIIPFSEKFVQITGIKKAEQKVIRQNLYRLSVFK